MGKQASAGSLVLLAMAGALYGCGQAEQGDDLAVVRTVRPIISGSACASYQARSAMAIILDAKIEDSHKTTFTLRSLLCTGTLIAPDVVLTAAHCVSLSDMLSKAYTLKEERYHVSLAQDLTSLTADDLSSLLGEPPDLPSDAIEVGSWVYHAGFDRIIANPPTTGGLGNWSDLALLFLRRSVVLVNPAVVLTSDEASQVKKGAAVAIAGWGQTLATSSDPNQLPGGTAGTKMCANTHVNEISTYEMQVGSGSSSSRKCHGDSGGPTYLTVETDYQETVRLIGVTSHAYDKDGCARGGVDMRVDAYLDWIDQQLKSACAKGQRVWCETPGIPEPDRFSQGDGCSLAPTRPLPLPWLPLALVLVLVGLLRGASAAGRGTHPETKEME